MSCLARLDPTVHDLSGWSTWRVPPTADVLAAARRNSPVSDWVATAASLPGLAHTQLNH